jgi:hypothetical protein
MMSTVGALFVLIQPILMVLGGLFVALILALKVGPRVHPGLGQSVQNRLLRMAAGVCSGTQALIQDSDGILTLNPAEYDEENNGYWVRTSGGYQFYSAEGDGGSPKWFYGATVVLAYDGLGGVTDLVSGEIGRQAKVKKRLSDEPGRLASGYEQLVGAVDSARERLSGIGDVDPLADGGQRLGEFEVALPKRAVVDLRDTLYNAPFHVRPAQFHRVEENAKAGQGGSLNENLIRFGLLVTGFMLAIVAQVVAGGGGGGGGGGAAVLPF